MSILFQHDFLNDEYNSLFRIKYKDMIKKNMIPFVNTSIISNNNNLPVHNNNSNIQRNAGQNNYNIQPNTLQSLNNTSNALSNNQLNVNNGNSIANTSQSSNVNNGQLLVQNFYDYINTEKTENLNREYCQHFKIKYWREFDLSKRLEILVYNSFIVNIKISFFTTNSNPLIKVSVCSIDEYSQNDPDNNYYFVPFKLKDKSKYCIMRKIEKMLDERIHFYILSTIFSFCFTLISKYSNLFKKYCSYCKKYSKYSFEDNSIMPPIYCPNSLENDSIFHEDCYCYNSLLLRSYS